MKKNLLFRLCLILVIAVTAYSCRTDQFPERETFNNSSKFQLTSKRISLNEAKHREKLLPELEKAEVGIEAFTKKNVHGKTVNLGDSISINTENVIYMENGPNYHTYTFNIQRSNLLPDAPVENLVLTPLPEGGYKAYIVAYNFTEAEKNTILNGGNVSVNGKSSVTPLEGTFASVMSIGSCTMQIYDYYTFCGEGIHNDGKPCKSKDGVYSQHISVMVTVCQGGNSPQPGIEEPIDYGSGEAGGAVPCSANGVYLEPQDPANTSCNGAVVTQPVLEFNLPKTPCQKIQEIGKDSRVKDLFAGLKGKTNSDREFCEVIRNVDGEIKHTPLEGQPGKAGIDIVIPVGVKIDAFFHSHYPGLFSVFSPPDLASLSQWFKNGHINNTDTFVTGVVTDSGTQYMMVIDDPAKFDTFADSFVKNGMIDEGLTEFWGDWNFKVYNIKQNGTVADNELGFVKLLADSNTGLKILKGSNNLNDWSELTIENGQIKPKPCN